MKKNQVLLLSVICLVLVFASLPFFSACSSSTAPTQPSTSTPVTKLPAAIRLASDASGSAAYADSVGMASIISKYTTMQVTVDPNPAAGPLIQKLRTGQAEMAMKAALNFWVPYHGTFDFQELGPTQDMRLVKIGHGSFLTSIVATKKLGIKSVAELKGNGAILPIPKGQISTNILLDALMLGTGLTKDDIKIVDVASLNDGIAMMKDGRAQLGWIRLGASALEDLKTSVPIRFLDAKPTSKENEKKMLDYCPLVTLEPVKGGSDIIPEDMILLGQDLYLVTMASVSDDVVYAITKTLYEKYDELAQINAELKDSFTKEASVSTAFDIPFHPGAVKFYKEVGIWTTQIEEVQKKALVAR